MEKVFLKDLPAGMGDVGKYIINNHGHHCKIMEVKVSCHGEMIMRVGTYEWWYCDSANFYWQQVEKEIPLTQPITELCGQVDMSVFEFECELCSKKFIDGQTGRVINNDGSFCNQCRPVKHFNKEDL